MLAQVVDEFLPPARILIQQLHSAGADAHFLRHRLRAFLQKPGRIDLTLLPEVLALVSGRAAAAARGDQRTGQLGMPEPEHQRCIRTLAEPRDMGCGHPNVSYDCGYVIGKVGVVVGSLILGDIRGRIATGGVRDAAIVAREIAHLGFPLPMVRGELVHEYDRIPDPGFFDVELYAIGVSVRHAGLLAIATVPSDSARRVTSRALDRHDCRRSRNAPT